MEQKDYRLAAIMYTDIAGFSRMMERDEAGTLELLRFHNELIGGIVERHHGTVIKTIGDAILVDFKNTVEALQSALEIQDKLYEHNKDRPGLPLLVRIGVHLGDIYFFENDALGEGINIAARLQSLARPGCICFSQDVYNLVLNKLEFRAEKLGKVSLKNITKEIHAYEITSPNVEFDPNRDKPRPGYKPGSYLEGEREPELPVGGFASSSAPASSGPGPAKAPKAAAPAAPSAPAAAPVEPADRAADRAAPGTRPAPGPREAQAERSEAPGEAPAAGEVPGADRSYSEEGSRNVLGEIRKAILQDIKVEGRRLSVREAIDRYGYYGVEAREVIASMADQGLLVKDRPSGGPGYPGGFNADEFSKNIGAAVEGLVGEIGRGIERGMARKEARGLDGAYYAEKYGERYGRHAARYARVAARREMKAAFRQDEAELDTGKWDKEMRGNEHWKPGEEERASDFELYREALAVRARKQRVGFAGNLTSFLAVNGTLWFINLTTSPGFLWAAIVSAAWGTGLLSSAVAAARGSAKLKEAEAMPPLDRGQLETYKKLNRVKDSLAMHGASAVGVPLLLGLINILTGPQFYWFLIPTAALVFSFLSHLLAFRLTKPRLEKKLLDSLGVEGGWKGLFRSGKAKRAAATDLGPYAEAYHEAERAKAAILSQAKAGSPLDEDLGPSLDAYLGQVRLLAQSANEIDRIVEAIPMAELERDKASLVAKEGAASAESLKSEYRRSIEEIEKQEKSYQELKDQSELLRLRLGSSVNQIKQMRIDMARLKAAGEGEDASSGLASSGLGRIKSRTDELSRYLEDLRKGYDESKRDPFAELEALEKAEDERKRLLAAGGAPGAESAGESTPEADAEAPAGGDAEDGGA